MSKCGCEDTTWGGCRQDARRMIHVQEIERLLELFLDFAGGEQAAMDSKVAKRPLGMWEEYEHTAGLLVVELGDQGSELLLHHAVGVLVGVLGTVGGTLGENSLPPLLVRAGAHDVTQARLPSMSCITWTDRPATRRRQPGPRARPEWTSHRRCRTGSG